MKRWPGDTRHDDTCFVPPASFHFFLRDPVTGFVPKVSHKVSHPCPSIRKHIYKRCRRLVFNI